MCAISGIIGGDLKQVIKMDGQQKHRGPDGFKAWGDNDVIIAHRWLSVTGESPDARQPFESERYVFVCNGEVYNHQELKIKHGLKCKSDSDNEVLFRGLVKQGLSFLSEVDGEYAFALFDKEKRELTLCRDHMGCKPLYYYLSDDRIIFASTISAIAAVQGLELNMRMLMFNFRYRYAPPPNTVYKNLFQVQPGTWTNTGTYYHFTLDNKPGDIEAEIVRSVKLRSHENACVSLSGGIDSGMIAAISKLPCITLSGPENELAAGQSKGVHHIVDGGTYDIEDMVSLYEQPYYALSPNYLLARRVNEFGYRVVLNGLGADELFYGYSYYGSGHPFSHFNFFTSEEAGLLFDRGMNFEEYYPAYYAGDRLTSYYDIVHYIQGHHVLRSDSMFGRFGVESRSPYLSKYVVWSVFNSQQYKDKRVLRDIFRRYLPLRNTEAKKVGFRLEDDSKQVGEFVEDNIRSLTRKGILNKKATLKTKGKRKRFHLATLNYLHERLCNINNDL